MLVSVSRNIALKQLTPTSLVGFPMTASITLEHHNSLLPSLSHTLDGSPKGGKSR